MGLRRFDREQKVACLDCRLSPALAILRENPLDFLSAFEMASMPDQEEPPFSDRLRAFLA